MKYLLTLAILLGAFLANCQTGKDTLAKYSYFINGFKKSEILHPVSGTGFFVRDKNKLLFVTANHVISGWNSNGTKDVNFPDEMTIWLNKEDGTIDYSKQIAINIKNVKATAPYPKSPIVPDVLAYEVNLPPEYQIYSIEKFFPASYPKDPEAIVIFGYPGTAHFVDGAYIISNSRYMVFTECPIYVDYPYLDDNSIHRKDSIDYVLEPHENSMKVDTLKGYSGSIVFISDKKTKKWSVMGQFTQHLNDKFLLFIKPEFIMEAIKRPYK